MVDALKLYFQRLCERQKSLRAGRPRTVYTIIHYPNSMKLSWHRRKNDRGELVLAWKDVNKVEAFKRDLYTVDLICLLIVLTHDKPLEINEEMEGWTSLVEKLPEYLPGCQKLDEWFLPVAVPAFKTNVTVIYHRNV